MKFAHKLTLALLVVLAVVLSLCNTVLIGQQFRQELHTAQETLSADWQRESRAMQRTLVAPGSGSLAARVGSYLQAITEQNSLACAAYSVDGTSLYYALPTAVPLSEVEALLAQDGEPRMVLANNHTLLCAGTVVLPERCITLVIAQDVAPVWQARQARTRNALIVELLAMVLAGGLVLLLCRRMTRPLEQLEQASRQIAAGAYSQRTAIHGSDEIASLSRSFDEMAQAVEGTVQTLQQNARQKDDFVAAFTHELKTPMTSILGFADILRSGEVSPATRRTAADYIYHESKRLEALSGNLLALMGLEQQPPQLEAVPLGRVLQSLRRALPQGSPVPTLPRSDAVVLAQPELLCDMLYNLIQNARKATPADGKVEVLLDETPTRLTIRVQDTGCGIPADRQEMLFRWHMRPMTLDYVAGGVGLGLPLAHQIARLHGGQLLLNSREGQGTTATIALPMVRALGTLGENIEDYTGGFQRVLLELADALPDEAFLAKHLDE
jgi:signal transduction histidine kinase